MRRWDAAELLEARLPGDAERGQACSPDGGHGATQLVHLNRREGVGLDLVAREAAEANVVDLVAARGVNAINTESRQVVAALGDDTKQRQVVFGDGAVHAVATGCGEPSSELRASHLETGRMAVAALVAGIGLNGVVPRTDRAGTGLLRVDFEDRATAAAKARRTQQRGVGRWFR